MRFLALIIAVFTLFSVGSQINPVFWNPDASNDIKSNTIYSFLPTSKGYMLIGTDENSYLYNGKGFLNIDSKIPLGDVAKFVEISNHRFLCFNFQGQVFLIDNELNVSQLMHFGKCVHLEKVNDKLYGIIDNKILRIDEITFETSELFAFEEGSVNRGARITGNTAFICQSIIGKTIRNYQIDLNTKKFTYIENNAGIQEYYVKENQLVSYIKYSNKITVQDLKKGTIIKEIQLPDTESSLINHIIITDNKELLVATKNGLVHFSSNLDYVNTYFQNKNITNLTEDLEKNIWIGVLGSGIQIIPSLQLLNLELSNYTNQDDIITNAFYHDSQIIIGTSNGTVLSVDFGGNLLWKLPPTNFIVQAIQLSHDKQSIFVHSKMLFQIDLKTGDIIQKITAASAKSIITRNNEVIIGTSSGLYIYASETRHLFQDKWIKKLYYFDDEHILMQTEDGIFKVHLNTELATRMNPADHLNPTSLTKHKNKFYYLYENEIFEALSGQSSSFKNILDKKIISIGSAKENFYKIYEDGSISIFDNFNEILLNDYNGLINHNIKKLLDAERYWISVSEKNLRLIPKDYKPSNSKPLFYVYNLTGTFKHQKNDIYRSKFKNNQLNFLIHLLPNTSSFGLGQVKYRIQTIAKDWINLESNSSGYYLQLDRLPSGKHTIEFMATNVFGNTSDISVYQLTLVPPYYKTVWFIFGCILMGLLIMFLVFKYINKRSIIKNKKLIENEKLKVKLIQTELTALRSQMNPHFIFNSLSSIQNKILGNQSIEAYHHLTMFAKLLRSALEYSRREYILLSEELIFIKNYIDMEQKRSNDPFTFMLNIDDTIKLDNIDFPSLILQPFVENAIVHGLAHAKGEKNLTINVRQHKNSIVIEIIDNGIGREMSRIYNLKKRDGHNSFATFAVKERIEILRNKSTTKTFVDIVDLEVGTKVVITINRDEKHEN